LFKNQLQASFGKYPRLLKAALVTASVALSSVFAANSANALIVNIDVNNQGAYNFTEVPLAAGTYNVTYATDPLFQAYNNCGTQGCIDANSFGLWFDQFVVDLPTGPGWLGSGIYAPAGDLQGGSVSAADAYARAVADLAANNFLRSDEAFVATYLPFNGPILLVLPQDQTVGFDAYTFGGYYHELTGGISLDIEAVGSTPLPAALPLFATGLGALGVLGWRRKRKSTAAIAA